MTNLPKNIAQQSKQLGEDVFEVAKKQPQELAEKALEQMRAKGLSSSEGQKISQQMDKGARELEKMKEADKARSERLAAKIVQELETEIKKWRKTREEQLKARRQQAQQPEEEKKQKKSPLTEPSTKPKKGLFGLRAGRHGFWSRRARRAREQAQPEMAGKRVGG